MERGSRVAQKMAHQNSLNLVSLSNCDFSYSVLEPLDGFKNSEIKLGIRLDVQVLRPELFNLYKKFRMALRCAKQGDIFGVPFFVQPA